MRACLHFASSFGFGFGGLIGFGDLVLGCRVGLRVYGFGVFLGCGLQALKRRHSMIFETC